MNVTIFSDSEESSPRRKMLKKKFLKIFFMLISAGFNALTIYMILKVIVWITKQ